MGIRERPPGRAFPAMSDLRKGTCHFEIVKERCMFIATQYVLFYDATKMHYFSFTIYKVILTASVSEVNSQNGHLPFANKGVLISLNPTQLFTIFST